MKWKVVLVPFPFDDFSGTKARPVVCLTTEVGAYQHIVVAFITSQATKATEISDIPIPTTHSDFEQTGLKVDSAIRLHRLITLPSYIILRELGVVSPAIQAEITTRLRVLFDL